MNTYNKKGSKSLVHRQPYITPDKQLFQFKDNRSSYINKTKMIKFIQRVQPPRPTIDTSTLKGKVLNRAFNNIGQDVKWSEEFHRWMFKCYHCSAWVTEEGVQADHYPTPQALGGSDELSNLVLACSSCNAANIHNAQQMLTRGKIASAGLARKYTE